MLSNAARMCAVFHKQPRKLRFAKKGDIFGERLCSKLYSEAQRGVQCGSLVVRVADATVQV